MKENRIKNKVVYYTQHELCARALMIQKANLEWTNQGNNQGQTD